ncbi:MULTISPECIES: DsbA family protein [Bacillaceae]|uniref:DsbA family protein n=1 Tax=Shouchella oshimensis TaxID=290588 RepID=UPI000AC5DB52|nr:MULTISPECIES: DsbA family protein [Bacillaceae]
MRNKLLVVLTLVVAIIVVIWVVINNSSNVDEEVAREFDETPAIDGQPYLEKAGAPVVVIEFGDYKCPSCKSWDETVFPQLKEEYIDNGVVKFVHINTPFHGEESLLAAQASESVWQNNPDSFWDFHKEIYQSQPETQQHDDLWVTEERLLEIANSIESTINLEQLESHLQARAFMDEIETDINLIEAFEVSQTPTIMINNYKMNNPFDYNALVELIEMENN